jgi:hypothetical protein
MVVSTNHSPLVSHPIGKVYVEEEGRDEQMKKIAALWVLLLAVAFACNHAIAANQDAEVKALVEKAVAMAEKDGKDAVLKAINDLKGPFVKGELYLFACSFDNVNLAEGSPNNKSLIGTDMGKYPFNVKMTELAKSKGSGWVEYIWPKPGAKVPSPKRTYIMRVPGQDYWIGGGYYTE